MPRRLYPLLTLTLLCGAFLRVWQLTIVPPGLHYDLAATALLGNEVAFNGFRPIFITGYTGHEVLFYYWLALWFQLIGSSVFALRLAAALLGVLTLAATFFATREVLHGEEQAPVLAALATALLAFAFFHVTFSRFGFRVITEPLIQALALGFLLRGVRAKKFWSVILAGVFTGLAAYTYLAARLFPIPLAAFWLVWLMGHRRAWRKFAAFALAASLTFAPLGLYFYQHPEDFLNRAGQVAPRAGETALLLTGVRRALEMVFIHGETYDRFNLPGLPLLYPALGVFFLIGLGLTLRNAFAPRALPRATEVLLLVWLPAMLLPTAISVHDVFPSNVRAFGLIPLLFVFPARGLAAAYAWAQKRWPGPLLPTAYPLTWLTVGILFFGTYVTAENYFGAWANLPNQRLNNDADLTSIAADLNARDLSDTAVFVSAIHYRHPTLAYLARDFDSILWLTGGTALVVPEHQRALYYFAPSAPVPAEWIANWTPLTATGDYRAYFFDANTTPPLPDFIPAHANFVNIATLTGYRLSTTSAALIADVRWHIENVPDVDDYLPYVRLYDATGVWAQSGGFSYPSAQWRVGDTLLTRLTLPLPSGLPPGVYTVKAGMYSANVQTSLPHLDERGGYAGERAVLGTEAIAGGPSTTRAAFIAEYAPTLPLTSSLTGALELLGYRLSSPTPRQGERVQVELFWFVAQPLTASEWILNFAGQSERVAFPRGAWEVLVTRHWFKVPVDASVGESSLTIAVADYGSATLGALSVQAVERNFDAPVLARAATFSDTLALLHAEVIPGATTQIVLHWQALTLTDTDYTVFVHVLDASGQIVAQRDAAPRRGAYPTSLWAIGEYVRDEYEFALAPGHYQLEVGAYVPEDGARLKVLETGGDAWVGAGFTVP